MQTLERFGADEAQHGAYEMYDGQFKSWFLSTLYSQLTCQIVNTIRFWHTQPFICPPTHNALSGRICSSHAMSFCHWPTNWKQEIVEKGNKCGSFVCHFNGWICNFIAPTQKKKWCIDHPSNLRYLHICGCSPQKVRFYGKLRYSCLKKIVLNFLNRSYVFPACDQI